MARRRKTEVQPGFVFSKELSQRLKALRVKAGLTQTELATRMGRTGQGGHYLVGRLERADVARPSVALIADYLRACRASFDDLADLLNAYTSRPLVDQERGRAAVKAVAENLPATTASQVLWYDVKTASARAATGAAPEKPDKRLIRTQRLAASLLLRRQLEDRLHRALNAMGAPGMSVERRVLAEYGRQAWGVISRTRGKDKREERRKLLADLRASAQRVNQTAPEKLDRIVREVYKLYVWLERKGDLDWLPTARRAEELVRRRKRHRVETDEHKVFKAAQAAVSKEMMDRFAFVREVSPEADRMIADFGIPSSSRGRYCRTVPVFLSIAQRTRPDSAERRKQVAAFLAELKTHNLDETLLLRIAQLTFTRHAERQAQP